MNVPERYRGITSLLVICCMLPLVGCEPPRYTVNVTPPRESGLVEHALDNDQIPQAIKFINESKIEGLPEGWTPALVVKERKSSQSLNYCVLTLAIPGGQFRTLTAAYRTGAPEVEIEGGEMDALFDPGDLLVLEPVDQNGSRWILHSGRFRLVTKAVITPQRFSREL